MEAAGAVGIVLRLFVGAIGGRVRGLERGKKEVGIEAPFTACNL